MFQEAHDGTIHGIRDATRALPRGWSAGPRGGTSRSASAPLLRSPRPEGTPSLPPSSPPPLLLSTKRPSVGWARRRGIDCSSEAGFEHVRAVHALGKVGRVVVRRLVHGLGALLEPGHEGVQHVHDLARCVAPIGAVEVVARIAVHRWKARGQSCPNPGGRRRWHVPL